MILSGWCKYYKINKREKIGDTSSYMVSDFIFILSFLCFQKLDEEFNSLGLKETYRINPALVTRAFS